MLQDILEVAKDNPNTPLSSTFISKETGIRRSSITRAIKSFARRKETNPKYHPEYRILYEPIGQGRYKILFTGDGY